MFPLSHALINMWFGGLPSKAVTLPVFHLARSNWCRVHKRRGDGSLLASELQATATSSCKQVYTTEKVLDCCQRANYEPGKKPKKSQSYLKSVREYRFTPLLQQANIPFIALELDSLLSTNKLCCCLSIANSRLCSLSVSILYS
ncbi:hypothetical protein CDV36_006173 [Fusarium kuroshium]|uniref:Uncharacterized protein n=1 Tax=Fusarium kuroshium TaxID=2010991 RepID=A0A3M2S9G6_9HYPO|nr:hypothetical protein CDV36_006173 [Fusarium kuroshium]